MVMGNYTRNVVSVTDTEKPLPSVHGIGPIWIDGVEYWSDGVSFNREYQLNSLNESRLAEIYKRIYAASKNGAALNYIISGDSTREKPKIDLKSIGYFYYKYLFNKLGITDVVLNASSGADATQWSTDVVTHNMSECVAAISGTGLNSIVEFSFGLNDFIAFITYEATKSSLTNALDAFIALRPDTAILLVTPVKTANQARNYALTQIYLELSEEYNLPLIDVYSAMRNVHGDVNYYSADYPPVLNSTHPNEFGQRRLVNVIVNAITPSVLGDLITFDDTDNNPGAVISLLFDVLWDTGSGNQKAGAGWISLEEIPVPFGATIAFLRHGGSRDSILTMGAGDVFIDRTFPDLMNDGSLALPLDLDVKALRINIDNSGYDYANDNISLVFSYMSATDINKGLAFKSAFKI